MYKETAINATQGQRVQQLLNSPLLIQRELNNRSLFEFLKWAWPELSGQPFVANWHIAYLCKELEQIAHNVGNRLPKDHDLLINVPPGSTKTILCTIVFPVWCWTQWYWMRFITASYSAILALESAEYSRDLIRSARFQEVYPELTIKQDKDTKSNYKIVKSELSQYSHRMIYRVGGGRFSTSVGGTLIGFHGDIIIWDDPLKPQNTSESEIETANRWIDETLPTRKTDKAVSTVIGIMQRIHQNDPSGHILEKKKSNLKHICFPGEIRNYYEQLQPKDVARFYKDDLFDARRMDWSVLLDLEEDMGQYGYAGQIGQNPTPTGGGMFKVDHFQTVHSVPPKEEILQTIRYWDKAATQGTGRSGTGGKGCFTVGVKMSKLTKNRYFVWDVKRGKWSTNERERVILETAWADGHDVYVYVEQEPGSGGKESAEATIRNLAGYSCYADRPTGDKQKRADPYSVQVNNGAFLLLSGLWNAAFIEEHRFFPFGTYKDQVDASSGAVNHLFSRKVASRIC